MKRIINQENKKYSAPAVKQAGDVLFCLAGSKATQMSLSEISARVGISGSKAFGILEALQDSGLVKRGKDGKGYSLGPGLVALSRKVLDDLAPSQLAEPILENLAKETKSTAVLGLITGNTVYIASKRESEGDIKIVTRVGHIMPLTIGAHGKAIVSFMAEEERTRILGGDNLHFFGKQGRIDKIKLTMELEECRIRGFACDFGVSSQGINVVAAPVLDPRGIPIGFVQIFVLSSQEKAVSYGPVVAHAGKQLSQQLGAQGD